MGGSVLVAWIIKGDMDLQINNFEFPGHWNNAYPCPACPCNKVQGSPTAWNNFIPTAEWKTKGIDSLDAFATRCEMVGKPLHQLFVPLEHGGLGMHTLSLYMDCLHVVDLGVAMHVCGNVLYLLCHRTATGSSTHSANIWASPHARVAMQWLYPSCMTFLPMPIASSTGPNPYS